MHKIEGSNPATDTVREKIAKIAGFKVQGMTDFILAN